MKNEKMYATKTLRFAKKALNIKLEFLGVFET